MRRADDRDGARTRGDRGEPESQDAAIARVLRRCLRDTFVRLQAVTGAEHMAITLVVVPLEGEGIIGEDVQCHLAANVNAELIAEMLAGAWSRMQALVPNVLAVPAAPIRH